VARTAATITPAQVGFLTERRLGTLTTVRLDGTLHVVAIAFTFDAATRSVWIITSDRTRKVKNVEAKQRAAVCQVDGARWMTLEGPAEVVRDTDRVAAAVAAYEIRYRPARPNPERVAIEIQVDRIMGRS